MDQVMGWIGGEKAFMTSLGQPILPSTACSGKSTAQFFLHRSSASSDSTPLSLKRVICMGVSNGAVLSLLAAANDENSLIDGLIAESPFLSLDEGVKDIIDLTMEKYPRWLGYAALAPLVAKLVSSALTYRIGGIKEVCSCIKIAEKISPRPILLIHGTADNRFRPRHSQLLYSLIPHEAKGFCLISPPTSLPFPF